MGKTLTTDRGVEIDVDCSRYCYDGPEMIEVGNYAIVGWLEQDEDCYNPMTDCDGEGELFTAGERVITDDEGEVLRHLGLASLPYRSEIYRNLEHDGVYEAAKEILWRWVESDGDFHQWCEENYERDEGEDDIGFHSNCFDQIDFGRYGTRIPSWLDTMWETAQEQAWDELYEQGKIGTYLAVPVNYCASCHGPGTTSISTTSIDNANAVWVPGEFEISNMHFTEGATYKDKLKVADKYADGCLDTYESWCNGDCYGYIVKVHLTDPRTGEYEEIEDDSCWGFIGSEYAEKELESAMKWQAAKCARLPEQAELAL